MSEVTLCNADSLTALQDIATNSVDALVTDPPAGIEFMGKEWDSFKQGRLAKYAKQPGGTIKSKSGSDFNSRMASHPNTHHKANPKCQNCGRYAWDYPERKCKCEIPDYAIDNSARQTFIASMTPIFSECLRTLKPGAYGVVWALPRTSHWTATALEDAGFEIRDVITHHFGSGFPKSLDVSKAIDEAAGAKREIIGEKASGLSGGTGNTVGVFTDSRNERGLVDITAPATDAARKWYGYGTALKPATEFWWLVRKPLSEKNVAANVLKWGTGGINVDRGKVGHGGDKISGGCKGSSALHGGGITSRAPVDQSSGRFPPNLALTHSAGCTEKRCEPWCPIEEMDGQSGERPGAVSFSRPKDYAASSYQVGDSSLQPGYADTGGASRFFPRFYYTAKASRAEREEGLGGWDKAPKPWGEDSPGKVDRDFIERSPAANHHPTVKPVSLMRWLIKLICPPGGLVLDPFAGSGSTGVAAVRDGYEFYGIEREKDYADIARARIANEQNKPRQEELSL